MTLDEANRQYALLVKSSREVIAMRSGSDRSVDAIAKHFEVSPRVLRRFLEERKVGRYILAARLADNDEVLAAEDQPPLEGDFRYPGYDAWQLVHHQHLSVDDARKKLGLRHKSEVFELLAQHKKAVDIKRQIMAEATAHRIRALKRVA